VCVCGLGGGLGWCLLLVVWNDISGVWNDILGVWNDIFCEWYDILGVCMILGMNKFVYKAVNRILLCVVAVYYSVLQCAAVCCSLVQCVAVWCSVLQCGAA